MQTSTKLRIGLYGSGRAAAEIISALPDDYTLTASIVFLPEQVGHDIGLLTGGDAIGVAATDDMAAAIGSNTFDVLLYAGLSGETLDQAMEACASAGVDMVHASHMNLRTALEPAVFDRLTELASASGARIVGTGILPGFWLDVFPAIFASTLPAPVSIEAESRADLVTWGAGVLRSELGLGQPMDDAPAPVAELLRESAELLADVLGIGSSRAEDRGGFVSATAAANVAGIDIEPGQRIGFDQQAVVTHDGVERVRITWRALPSAAVPGHERGITLTVTGGDGEQITVNAKSVLDPYPGTAARFIHAARAVRHLPGGLRTPIELSI